MNSIATVDRSRLNNELAILGLRGGDRVVVRMSLRSLGRVDGGVATVLNALQDVVGREGAVYSLSFTRIFRLPLTPEGRAYIYDRHVPSTAGAFPNFLLQQKDAVRSDNPATSFVGVGHGVQEVLLSHMGPWQAYEPIRRLAKDGHGKMLLVGIHDTSPGMTTVHVAQNLLQFTNTDLNQFGVLYRDARGEVQLYRIRSAGGCSRGFSRFYEPYRAAGAVKEGPLGCAAAMLATLQQTLEIDLKLLREDPTSFFCDDRGCLSCRRSWSFYREPWHSWYPNRAAHAVRSIRRRLKV